MEIATYEQPYFTTALITPDKIFIVLENCMYSVAEAKKSQEKWSKIFYEQGSRAAMRLSNEMQFSLYDNIADNVDDLSPNTNFIQVATFPSDKYDKYDKYSSWASVGEWQIITTRFTTTDLSSEYNVLTAYYSLNSDGDRMARMRIALHVCCIGQEKTMDYYDKLPGSLFEE